MNAASKTRACKTYWRSFYRPQVETLQRRELPGSTFFGGATWSLLGWPLADVLAIDSPLPAEASGQAAIPDANAPGVALFPVPDRAAVSSGLTTASATTGEAVGPRGVDAVFEVAARHPASLLAGVGGALGGQDPIDLPAEFLTSAGLRAKAPFRDHTGGHAILSRDANAGQYTAAPSAAPAAVGRSMPIPAR
jgi:hypothetical protein